MIGNLLAGFCAAFATATIAWVFIHSLNSLFEELVWHMYRSSYRAAAILGEHLGVEKELFKTACTKKFTEFEPGISFRSRRMATVEKMFFLPALPLFVVAIIILQCLS